MASLHIQLLSLALLIFSVDFISAAKSHRDGFTVDLIHRDSPQLTGVFPGTGSSSSSNKLLDEIRRSIARANQIQAAASAKAAAQVIPAGGAYVLDISIGTPPKRFVGIADTGSDLTWTQCQPCDQCFDQSIPIFDPRRSSTYAPLPCESTQCKDLPEGQSSCSSSSSCTYTYSYGDQSSTAGDLSTETLTIDPQTAVSNFSFGCGHQNMGSFKSAESGLIGLGQGPLSLASQTRDIPAFGGKFAYCFTPRSLLSQSGGKSKMSFGKDAIVSGSGAVSTPIVNGRAPTFYYLTLESVSVGSDTISYNKRAGRGPSQIGSSEGNIIIDSGTTLTFLPEDIYQSFVSSFKKAIKGTPVAPPQGLELCYEGKVDIPNATFHFDGADLVLTPVNTFVEVEQGVQCLAVASSAQTGTAIFGNFAQINFLVGYDLAAQKVSFKPTDCSTYE